MEELKSSLIPFYNGFSKNSIEERIRAIMKTRKKTIGTVVLGLLIIVTVTVLFATSAKNNFQTEKESVEYKNPSEYEDVLENKISEESSLEKTVSSNVKYYDIIKLLIDRRNSFYVDGNENNYYNNDYSSIPLPLL